MTDKTSTAPVMSPPCPECGGKGEWFSHMKNSSQVVDGRLKTCDVTCLFVLGCEECSETIKVCTADEIAARMNNAPTPDVVGGDVVICHRWVNGDERTDWFDADVLSAADVPRIEAMGFRLERAYAAPRVQGDALRNYEELNREFSNGFELGKSLNGSVANGSIVTDEMITAAKLAFYSGGSHTLSAEREHIRRALEAALAAQPKGDAREWSYTYNEHLGPTQLHHPAEQTRGEPLIVPQLPHGSDRNPLPDFSSFRTAIDEFVNRFLSWELPDDVCADPVACKVGGGFPRYGTNLLTHAQAKVMIERVLMPPQIDGWFAGTEDADGNELVTMRADDPRLAKPETGQTRGDGVDAVSYTVEAVAEVVRGAGGQNKLSFVVEGAEASLEVGTMLYAIPFMTPPDDGSVELYDAPRQAVPDGWKPISELPTGLKQFHAYTSSGDQVIAYRNRFGVNYEGSLHDDVSGLTHYRRMVAAPSAGRMGVGS